MPYVSILIGKQHSTNFRVQTFNEEGERISAYLPERPPGIPLSNNNIEALQRLSADTAIALDYFRDRILALPSASAQSLIDEFFRKTGSKRCVRYQP